MYFKNNEVKKEVTNVRDSQEEKQNAIKLKERLMLNIEEYKPGTDNFVVNAVVSDILNGTLEDYDLYLLCVYIAKIEDYFYHISKDYGYTYEDLLLYYTATNKPLTGIVIDANRYCSRFHNTSEKKTKKILKKYGIDYKEYKENCIFLHI